MPPDPDLATLRRERDLYLRLLTLGAHDDLEALLDEAIEVVTEMLDASLGYLCVLGPGEEEPAWERASATDGARPDWSSTVIEQVLRTGEPVVTDSVSANPHLSWSESISRLSLEAILCVPIRVGQGPTLGALYVHRALTAGLDADAVARARVLASALAGHTQRLLQRAPADDPTAPWRAQLRADALVGSSRALAELLRTVARAVRAQRPTLLTGPTGSGKSTVARVLHDSSRRRAGPFVDLDVGTVPDTLFESTLFGTVAHAYSDAADAPGHVEEAEGGTLFLDEIGNLSIRAQGALLQLIDRQAWRRVGSTGALRPADVWIVAATNVDLRAAVEAGAFRADLLHRFAAHVAVPGLDARIEDVPRLAEAVALAEAQRTGATALPLGQDALAALLGRPWPGHVRELTHVVTEAQWAAEEDHASQIGARHLPTPLGGPAGTPERWDDALTLFRRRFLAEALARHGGNRTHTARAIGLSRAQLHAWINELGLGDPGER